MLLGEEVAFQTCESATLKPPPDESATVEHPGIGWPPSSTHLSETDTALPAYEPRPPPKSECMNGQVDSRFFVMRSPHALWDRIVPDNNDAVSG